MGVGLWVGVVRSSPVRLSRKILGNSRARRKILGIIGWEFWEFCITRRHHSQVNQSRPEKRRNLCHVTQPRARVNVSCSRAGPKGATGERGDHKKRAAEARKGQRRRAEGWVPDQGTRPGYQTKGGQSTGKASEGQRTRADHKGAAGGPGTTKRPREGPRQRVGTTPGPGQGGTGGRGDQGCQRTPANAGGPQRSVRGPGNHERTTAEAGCLGAGPRPGQGGLLCPRSRLVSCQPPDELAP